MTEKLLTYILLGGAIFVLAVAVVSARADEVCNSYGGVTYCHDYNFDPPPPVRAPGYGHDYRQDDGDDD